MARLLRLVSALALTACASMPRDAGFGDVQAGVAERTGKEVHWNRGTAEDAAAAESVRGLLERELDADGAVQIALLNNRELQATYQELGIAQADLVAAGLLRNPVFDLGVRFPEGGGPTELELGVVQDFLSILFRSARRRIAAAGLEAAKLRVTGAVLDLAGEVRAAFYTHEGARQWLEMRRTILAAAESSFELARRMHAAGNLSDLDLANERSLYEQSKLDAASAELAVVEARERINALLGLSGPATEWRTAGRLPEVPGEAPAVDDLEREAVARSLELEGLRVEIDLAAERLGLARSTRLAAEADVGAAAEREEGSWEIGPQASFPLPLFDRGQAETARTRAELRRLEELHAARAVALESEVRALASRVSMLRAREAHYREVILPLRREILDETQKQYNAMQVGAFQLLQAKQEEVQAGSEYVRTLRDYWIAAAALELLASGGRPRSGQQDAAGALGPAELGTEGTGTGAGR